MPIRWCQRATDLVDAAPGAQLVLTEPLDVDGTCVAAAVSRLRERTPYMPVIAYTPLTADSVKAMAVLAAHALHSVVIRGVDDSKSSLRQMVGDALWKAHEVELWALALPDVPSEFLGILQRCIEQSSRPQSVSELALAVSLPERTLHARLRRAGLPSAQELIAWCRLVRVASSLHDSTLTLEVIAERLAFPTTSAVHALVTRLTGLTPGALRRANPTARTLAALRQRLHRPAIYAALDGDVTSTRMPPPQPSARIVLATDPARLPKPRSTHQD